MYTAGQFILSRQSRAKRGGIRFELFLEYTASQNFASEQVIPRGARRAARLGFERAFWAKTKRIYQYGQKKFLGSLT